MLQQTVSAVYSKNLIAYTNMLCGCNSELSFAKHGGTCTNIRRQGQSKRCTGPEDSRKSGLPEFKIIGT